MFFIVKLISPNDNLIMSWPQYSFCHLIVICNDHRLDIVLSLIIEFIFAYSRNLNIFYHIIYVFRKVFELFAVMLYVLFFLLFFVALFFTESLTGFTTFLWQLGWISSSMGSFSSERLLSLIDLMRDFFHIHKIFGKHILGYHIC